MEGQIIGAADKKVGLGESGKDSQGEADSDKLRRLLGFPAIDEEGMSDKGNDN